MVYIFTFVGFMMGFGIGLGTVNVLLRHRTKEEIQEDHSLRWKYGTAVWGFAIIGGVLGYWIFNYNFY